MVQGLITMAETNSKPKAALEETGEQVKKASYGIIKTLAIHVKIYAHYYLIFVLGFCLGLLVHV